MQITNHHIIFFPFIMHYCVLLYLLYKENLNKIANTYIEWIIILFKHNNHRILLILGCG